MVVSVVVENGIRILIPVSIATGAGIGAWLASEDSSQEFESNNGATVTPLNLNEEERREFEENLTDDLMQQLEEAQ